jgi:CRISPR-associated protein Cas1
MLSLPDFRQKQIIYIESFKNKKIHFLNQNLIIEEKEMNPKTKREKYKITNQIPCGKIFCVFIIGNFTFTNILIQRFIKHGISIFFLNFNFRYYAGFNPKTEGNVLLRKKQYTLPEEIKLKFQNQ